MKIPGRRELDVRRLGVAQFCSPLHGSMVPDDARVAVSTDPAVLEMQVRAGAIPAFLRWRSRQQLGRGRAKTRMLY